MVVLEKQLLVVGQHMLATLGRLVRREVVFVRQRREVAFAPKPQRLEVQPRNVYHVVCVDCAERRETDSDRAEQRGEDLVADLNEIRLAGSGREPADEEQDPSGTPERKKRRVDDDEAAERRANVLLETAPAPADSFPFGCEEVVDILVQLVALLIRKHSPVHPSGRHDQILSGPNHAFGVTRVARDAWRAFWWCPRRPRKWLIEIHGWPREPKRTRAVEIGTEVGHEQGVLHVGEIGHGRHFWVDRVEKIDDLLVVSVPGPHIARVDVIRARWDIAPVCVSDVGVDSRYA